MRNLKGQLWNCTQYIVPIYWKIRFSRSVEILKAFRFKSLYAFLKRPQHTDIKHGLDFYKIYLTIGWKSCFDFLEIQLKPCQYWFIQHGVDYLPWAMHLDTGKFWMFFDVASIMMTSSNGNIFRVIGPLCGEFTAHRWIPRTKASDSELWCFLWSVPE